MQTITCTCAFEGNNPWHIVFSGTIITECVPDSNEQREMIIFELLLTTFESSVILFEAAGAQA